MSLQSLQDWLQAAIRTPGDAQLRAQAGGHLQSSARLDAAARLAIYQRSYRARLLQSFHAIFPGLLHALGPELLDRFALEFLEHHPPHHPSVNRVAEGFAEHLQRTRPPAEHPGRPDWTDFILDLARLEMALLEVSEARGLEQTGTVDSGSVRALTGDGLLRCMPRGAPCLRLLEASYPVHDYLQALRAGDTPHTPDARLTCLALTRVHYRLATRELAPVQWQLLRRLDGRTSLSEALRAVTGLGLRPTPDAALARVWLGNFLAQGLLESVEDPPVAARQAFSPISP